MKAGSCVQGALLVCTVVVASQTAFGGLTNEWTKPTSGYWEETNYWSLGVLPSMQQDAIMFANEGYKALAIGPSTTANHATSLSINNLTVDRPSNLLLLNYAGLNVPLRIASNFVLGRDASLLSYYSSLNASNFYCSGSATFAELSVATFNLVQVGALSPASAELILSNTVISAATFHVGAPGSNGPPGRVNQYGGLIQVTGTNAMEVRSNSVYNLNGGTIVARRINVWGRDVPSAFTMSGGRMELSDSLWMARAGFQLKGGELQTPTIGVPLGSFTHSNGRNTVGDLWIGSFIRADYLFQGGTLSSSNVSVGTFSGLGFFNQSGGVHTNSARITLHGVERTGHHTPVGEYMLSSGFLVSPKLDVAGGRFAQSGGTNLAGDVVLDFFGAFALSGGDLECSNLILAATNGSVVSYTPCVFLHSNGVNTVKNQLIINDDPSSYYYSQRTRGGLYQLDAGTLNSHFVDVKDQFVQSGGLHSNDQIVMVHGTYRLIGGALSSPFLHVDGAGGVTQTGGTNAVQSLRVDVRAAFNLNGGRLSALNTTVTGGDRSMGMTNRASFTQSNGTHIVQQSVTVDGIYRLNGGTLSVPSLIVKPDGDLWLSGGIFTNRDDFTMYDGVCYVHGEYTNLGKLYVRLGFLSRTTNAGVTTLDMTVGSTVLRFRDSRDVSSEWNGRLMIRNWSGSTNGAGTDQVFVGTTAQGLTSAQLQRITFFNPEGLPPGVYSARILATGEIVPGTRASLVFSRTAGRLVLSWIGNYELWTTTNLLSPWSLVPGATSPYTNSLSDPQRYFKLRLSP